MAKIYIYGSCVSRDTFDFIDKTEHQLLGYTARQSLISTFSEPYGVAADSGVLESRFQVRNLQGDFDGNLLPTLEDIAPETDYIFWDLTDERLGVIKVDQETYITKSVELAQSGLLDDLENCDWLKFGTDEHFALWCDSVRKLSKFAARNLSNSTIVLVNLPWALFDDHGNPVGRTWNLLPDEANNLLARYASVIRESLDVKNIEISWEDSIASTLHKWGLAPYHYQDSVYKEVVSQFAKLDSEMRKRSLNPGSEEESNIHSAMQYRDALVKPHEYQLMPNVRKFGVQFEAKSKLAAGRHVLIALSLENAEEASLTTARIMKSGVAHIGHFRYVEVANGQRSYYETFDIPEGVVCRGVRVLGWQVDPGEVLISNEAVFPTAIRGEL
ncbi:DUF6270 domain-containing protein [Arthrobacter sp. 31Y]|uniref:DUF6270 domain-containing protein n=1 Tax=Arthrobacter sp. 31Y TaxID=1115632 RepID=UPI0004676F5C|nr:DUF6270 domain-containing protein [Arthrobacter sp. 31Y]